MKHLLSFLFLCFNIIIANAQSFDTDIKKLSESIVETVDVDARKFDSCINVVETRIAKYDKLPVNVKNATELSVLHAVAGWMYSNTSSRRTDIRNSDVDYSAKSSEHWSHVLDNKPELAKASGKDYKALVSFENDGELFNHDMLMVMTSFYLDNVPWHLRRSINDSIYEQVKSVYDSLGRVKASEVLEDMLKDKELSKSKPEDRDSLIMYWRDIQKKYAKSRYINNYINAEKALLVPKINFYLLKDGENELFANKPFTIGSNYWNCKHANLTIREYVGEEQGRNRWQAVPKETGKIVKNYELSFGNDSVNRKREMDNLPVQGNDSVSITLPVGKYVFVYKSEAGKEVEIVNMSSLRLITLVDDDSTRCYVLDALTGKPVKGATVKVMDSNNKKHVYEDLKTNADGEAVFTLSEKRGRYDIAAFLGKNDSIGTNIYHYKYNRQEHIDTSYITRIFLDRAIYRPGQTVHGYAVVYQQISKDVYSVVRNRYVDVTCVDKDDKEIYSDLLLANELGSVDFTFTLPADAELGRYYIKCEDNGLDFRVEEYKRPTWELSLEPVTDDKSNKGGVTYGDTVYVKGIAQSYSGVPVQGGTVEYELCRENQQHRYWFLYGGNPITYDRGELTVGEDGSFIIPMPLVEAEKDVFATRYSAKVNVVDMAGEAHQETYSLRVLRNDFAMDIVCKSQIDLNKESDFVINAIDAIGNKVDVEVTCTLSLGNKVEVTKVVPANKPFRLSALYDGESSDVPVGTFQLKANAKDRKGREIVSEIKFTVFDTNPKTLATRRAEFAEDFFYVPCDTMKNGQSQIVYFCPAYDDVDLFVFQNSGKKIYRHSHSEYGKKIHVLTVNPLPKDGENCVFSTLYVKDGEVHCWDHSFVREVPEERIAITWSTFRDHLQPGQKETWQIKVSAMDGKPMNGVEFLATMYDASLDSYSRNEWTRIGLVNRRDNLAYNQFSISRNYVYLPTITGSYKILVQKGYFFDRFTLFNDIRNQKEKLSYTLREVRFSSQKAMKTAAPELSGSSQSVDMREYEGLSVDASAEALQGKIAGLDMVENSEASDVGEVMRLRGYSDVANVKVTPRTNFSETAFFYPHLMTDKDGEVEISFTLPESLTRWKFCGFAHDAHMKNGVITAEAIAQKQFMVQPQMPRFIRVGDKATIATRIINQSDKALTGKAVMRLIHAKDESLISAQSVDFSVEAGKTTSVSFPLTAVSSDDDIICEIVAEANDGTNAQVSEKSQGKKSNGKVSQLSTLNPQLFSDGERNLIPVLPSRMVITESVPFYIKGGEEKNVNLSSLYNGNSKTADEKTMSIEFTANPVWTVVEALRGIQTPESPCATSLAASIYANSMLSGINKELRSYTDKQIIDEDSVKSRLDKSWNALKALQNRDGGFRWFPGFDHSSYYVTLSVAEQLVKAIGHANEESKVSQLSTLNPQLSYLDSIQVERYEWNKAHKVRIRPSESDLHYLYVCSMCPDRKVGAKTRKVREEYLSYLEKNMKELSIYGIASSASILRAFGHKTSAEKFLNAVRHYLVYDEGQGKHFESSRAQYSWRDYRIPTQVAAMSALYTANPDDENLNDMTLWLLRQKQVQTWDNPINTVDVADLLLKKNAFGRTTPPDEPMNASRYLPSTEENAGTSLLQMTLNGIPLTQQSFVKDNVKDTLYFAEEMGYMNKQVDPSLIGKDDSSLFTLRSSLPNISWGAVTATFTEDFDRLKSYTTGEVKISRRLMVERDGKWVDMKKDEVLKVGQKVRVRHTLKTDRDMDFVRIKSLHPACFEPADKLSGYCWKGGEGCYQSIHDSNIEIFFERFHEGTSTIDIEYLVTRPGTYNMGITTAECTYAPMFSGHSDGMVVTVK